MGFNTRRSVISKTDAELCRASDIRPYFVTSFEGEEEGTLSGNDEVDNEGEGSVFLDSQQTDFAQENSLPDRELNEEKRKNAYADGFAEGYKAAAALGYQYGEDLGWQEGQARLGQMFERVSQSLQDMAHFKSVLLQQGQEVFISIVKICCEKILRGQIAENDDSLLFLYNKALSAYRETDHLVIEMNPEDAKRLEFLLRDAADAGKVRIRANPSYAAGDFVLESDEGVSFVDLKKNIETIISDLKDDLFSLEKKDHD